MRYKIIFSFIFILAIHLAVAQKDITISPKELKNLTGCWQGVLNYSGTVIRKPYTTTAELIIRQIGESNKFEFLYIYTKDPNENLSDTIAISKDGDKINDETIQSKRHTIKGNLEIITEVPGFDHDNNKAAILRHTYIIGKCIYTYKKEIKLKGQTDWLKREEHNYTRKPCK